VVQVGEQFLRRAGEGVDHRRVELRPAALPGDGDRRDGPAGPVEDLNHVGEVD
jgi:hypothetical protein